jgi:hypothetical protein
MQAKREVSKLYDDIKKLPYLYLFNAALTATRLWRCVEFMRAVDAALKEQERTREGREKIRRCPWQSLHLARGGTEHASQS